MRVERFELRRGDASAWFGDIARRDLCRTQGTFWIGAMALVTMHDRSHEGHRRGGAGRAQKRG